MVWEKSAGTPVPSGELPCGDISPTVGIVGTPVIDTATNAIYAVADTWDASKKKPTSLLKGYSLTSGEEVLSTAVDPPGSDPKALLQRTALKARAGWCSASGIAVNTAGRLWLCLRAVARRYQPRAAVQIGRARVGTERTGGRR